MQCARSYLLFLRFQPVFDHYNIFLNIPFEVSLISFSISSSEVRVFKIFTSKDFMRLRLSTITSREP